MSEWFPLVSILGVVLTAVGFGLYHREKARKRRFTVPAEAVIIDTVPCDRAGKHVRIVFSYTAYGNTLHVVERRILPSRYAKLGQTVVIRYDPHRPSEFVSTLGFGKTVEYITWGILGIAVTLASFLLLI